MHEVSVVTAIADAVAEELSRRGFSKVNSVTVLVGDLTSLGEEQMSFAWEVVTRGTVLDGSALEFERVPIEVRCGSCGYVGPVRMLEDPDYDSHAVPVLSCPECGGPIEVVRGMECAVKCMDVEDRWASSTGTRRRPGRSWTTSARWTSTCA